MKTYLQSYEPVMGGYATNGHAYWLNVLHVSWWGLMKEEEQISMLIPFYSNLAATLAKYDELIKNQTPLK